MSVGGRVPDVTWEPIRPPGRAAAVRDGALVDTCAGDVSYKQGFAVDDIPIRLPTGGTDVWEPGGIITMFSNDST